MHTRQRFSGIVGTALTLFVVGGVALAAPAPVAPAPVAPAPAAAPPVPAPETAPVFKTVGPVTIDGLLDEPCWQSARAVRADYAMGAKGELSTVPHLTVKYAWDEHYLYIGYETFDRNLVAVASGVTDGPESNRRPGGALWKSGVKVDVVEFFLSLGDRRLFWELHHNAANQFNDVWCTVLDQDWPISASPLFQFGIIFGDAAFLQDEGAFTVAMAVRPKPAADKRLSTVNDEGDTDTGYTAEIRLPWLSLGAAKSRQASVPASDRDRPGAKTTTVWQMAGAMLHILAVVQDGDGAPRYHHSSPTFHGDWFHKGFADWPVYQCAGPE